MDKKIILNGIRSNEIPTIGNYIGSLKPIVDLQQKYGQDYNFHLFVPDLHSFTTPINHQDLYFNTIQNIKYYIAAGIEINLDNTYIYRQSYIPAHSELAIILNNFTTFGQLSRMTQFKDKSSDSNNDSVSSGLFTYPVLMAADILLYGAEYIPVGEDQKQHLEFTRDLAQKFNQKFLTDILTVPAPWDKQIEFSKHNSGVKIKSLKFPDKKMSKSKANEDPKGVILLNEDPLVAYDKIMSATTDNLGQINYDPDKQPGITNLINILSNLINQPIDEIIKNWQGKDNYVMFKKAVAEEVKLFLENFQKKLANLDEAQLMRKLESSEYLLRDVATQRLYKIQQIVGLRP